ncbi:hypothetical protein M422DRAFT_23694 [Sphaerobolus stellatus SS14]|nr:hypothetical protein M422DRAFT_23694 [Sphaerobolus stellatus SS14]
MVMLKYVLAISGSAIAVFSKDMYIKTIGGYVTFVGGFADLCKSVFVQYFFV